MNVDSYILVTTISILLNVLNIIISFLLLRETNFKSGFIFLMIGLGIILAIQVNDFFTRTYITGETIILSSFEIVSLIGNVILFFVLIIFVVSKKLESQLETQEEVSFYRPPYNFYKPTIPEQQHIPEASTKSPTHQRMESTTEKKTLSLEEHRPIQQKYAETITEKKVEKEKHVKEIPANGKAVVAKFIKKEEPRSETEKLKDELEKLKFQRDKLVSIISHDLRTPLTSVFGYCQLLKEGQYKSKKEVEKFAENIFELSQQQLNALNKIVEWTKYESPNLTLNPTEFDVTSTINFVAKTMLKFAEKKNIRIIVNSKPDLLVYGDEFMIIEVLKNLLDNAIKFSHPNSSIEIHTHYHEKINKLVVLVVDSGIGIDRDILINLLVSTKKFTTRGTKGEKGLGLGLLIVKAIIDKHGEHFWIASEEGKWTRVYFTLKPAKSPNA